ncbi:hypothetical protein IAQ61_002683 [Plenodomus lingam]|uniref:uncharacterized protein n=1 Tax=Leptosphaeria maculans TaxID=5022 RepID=UPI0033305564|nr:hypothetical protein IAQ61_002683 [Plenodomus lingam]
MIDCGVVRRRGCGQSGTDIAPATHCGASKHCNGSYRISLLKSYRTSYADFGDVESNAVILFCGALMGTRFCYSPLDQLAKAYNVRILHPDRPGIGGSDSVELDKRIQIWLGRFHCTDCALQD